MQRPPSDPQAVVRHAHARTDESGDTVSYPEHEHAGGGDFHEHLALFDYRGPCGWLHVAPACGILAAYWCNAEKVARCTPCAHAEAEEWPVRSLVKIHARTVTILGRAPNARTLCGLRAYNVSTLPVADFLKLDEVTALENGTEPCEPCGYEAHARPRPAKLGRPVSDECPRCHGPNDHGDECVTELERKRGTWLAQ